MAKTTIETQVIETAHLEMSPQEARLVRALLLGSHPLLEGKPSWNILQSIEDTFVTAGWITREQHRTTPGF